MNSPRPPENRCCRCGECCRWLPVAEVRECSPGLKSYYRERGLRESGGMFLADAPCRHLQKVNTAATGMVEWICDIHETRPAVCRNYLGKSPVRGTEYFIPESCAMAGRNRVS